MGVVQRQGIKNTISSYLGITIGFVSLLIIQPRFLTTEEIGLARVLFAFSVLVSTIIPFGLINVIIKYFPVFKNEKNGHHGFLGFALLFFVAGFTLSAVGLVVFKEFIIAQYRRESPLVIYYYSYIFPFSFFIALGSVLTGYLTALFKSTVPSYLSDVGVRLGFIFLIFLYYFKLLSLPQFIGGYVGIYALQTTALIIYLLQVDKPSLRIDWSFLHAQNIGEMLRFGLTLSLAGMAALGLKTLDSVFLGKFKELHYVGVYTIASFIPTVIEAPLNALDRIASARIAHAYSENNKPHIEDVFLKSVKYLSLIGGLLFVGINTNITYLLNLIGKDFTQGVGVVYIISVGSLITMFGGSSNALLVYTSKPWQGALMLMGLVGITIICNMLLIPRFGLNGAAMSTAISAFLFTAGKFVLNYNRFGFQPYGRDSVKIVFIILLCFGVNYVLPVANSDIVNIILRSVVLGGLYLLLVYGMKLLPEFHRYLPWWKK